MRRSHKQKDLRFAFRTNRHIRAQTIRLIDENGKQIGIVSLDEALKIAQDREIDLVEVGPGANPPVVKLIDYSKFLYQQKKRRQEEKKHSSVSQTKQIQLGPFIGEHDLEIKVARAKEFLDEGDKVKFVVKFRGRAITKTELGRGLLSKIIENMQDEARIEREPHMEGRQMIMIVSKGSKNSQIAQIVK